VIDVCYDEIRGCTMAAVPKKRWTVKEYFALERESEEKHEFIDGDVYAMSGASLKHNRIVRNVITSLTNQLTDEQPCESLPSDMRVKVNRRDYTYPDVTVFCGEPHLETDADLDTLLNPTLIVEVLSPSTANFDRSTKFQKYKQIDSFQEYVLIEQDSARVERFLRQPDGQWLYRDAVGLEDSLELQSIGCTLALADVYRQVKFDAETDDTPSVS
jgi:Uma2 family endonuclease